MIRKIIAGIVALLALVVATVTTVVVAGYWRTLARHDLTIMLLPIVIPLALAGIAIFAVGSSARTGKKSGGVIGFCLGSTLYLIFPALQLLMQYEMIRQDGTGFWAVIMLPSVYLGIPLPIVGWLLGFTIGCLVDWRQRKRNVRPTTPPYSEPAARSPQR
jgi:hypothetical protein